jgi:hypothetical protein
MKINKFILLAFGYGLLGISCILSQDSVKSVPFFVPQATSFEVSTNFHWVTHDGIKDKFIDQMYINAYFKYIHGLQIVVTDKTKSVNGETKSRFSDIYITYTDNFRANANIPVFKYGLYLNVKAGMQEWIPTFTNTQLILENAEKYINPQEIYGGSIVCSAPVTRDRAFSIYFGAHTGDVVHHYTDPELLNLYASYTKMSRFNLGLSAQVGIAQGSRHIVNFAHLLYQPKFEELQCDIKAGKLPTVDAAPYGIHMGVKRDFKYISIGGYYEKRLYQNTRKQIAGISWHIIGPPKIAKFISTFNLFYDFNTNTVWMWIPFLKVDVQHR